MIYFILVPILVFILMLILLHIGFIPPRLIESKTPNDFNMDFEQLKIQTAKNKSLFCWFIPNKETYPLIIISHGWGSNSEQMLPIAEQFFQAGYNILLFDSRCHGKSDGDTFSALPRFTEDIEAVIEQAKKQLSFNGKIVLLGHSVGAGAVLYAASRRNDVSAVISLSAFGSPQWLMTRYFQDFKLPAYLICFLNAYIQWVIGHKFDEIAPVNTIKKITIPTLLVHGTDDKTVPIEDAYAIQNNNSNGYFLSVDGADHGSIEKLESNAHLLIDFVKDALLLPETSTSK